MIIDKFGQYIYNEDELFNQILSNQFSNNIGPFFLKNLKQSINKINDMLGYTAFLSYEELDISVKDFDNQNQKNWLMPDEYKNMDIVDYILKLCNNETEKQRCAEELLLYCDYDLLDLLKYLKYLVDIMEEHNIIWGVGRGSSVASFVLYKLKIHKVDSIYYGLDIKEFLRDKND